MKSRMIERRKVIQGVGAGLPENQKAVGSARPQEDARIAAQTHEEREQEAGRFEQIETMCDYIADCIDDGFITYLTKSNLEDTENLDYDELRRIYKEAKEWRSKTIEDEILEELPTMRMDDPLYNPINDVKRRKAIEEKLKPMDFTEMLFNGYCDQKVPIRNNFEVVFRTLTTTQSLWVESSMVELKDKSVQYIRHYSSLVQLAICLQSVNGTEVQPSLVKFKSLHNEEAFKKALEKRMEFIGGLPQVISDDLIIHYTWFTLRVRKMLGEDLQSKLGN